MREILFRGKAVKSNKWVFGDYVSDAVGISHKEYLNEYGDIGDVLTYVIPETVGQYTGLTDNNGKKIFEGDIVNVNTKRDETHSMYQGRHLIIRFDEYHRFVASGRLEYPLCNHYEWEITSNIYDNPELLKGGTDNGHP